MRTLIGQQYLIDNEMPCCLPVFANQTAVSVWVFTTMCAREKEKTAEFTTLVGKSTMGQCKMIVKQLQYLTSGFYEHG